MALTAQNFTMNVGETKQINFYVTDTNGDPVNLTSSTIEWAMSATSLSTPLIDKSTDTTGVAIISATGGLFRVYLDPTDTTGYPGVYYHEARYVDSAGSEAVVALGYVTINGSPSYG